MTQQKVKHTDKLQLFGFSTFNLPSISKFSNIIDDSMKFITTEKNIQVASKDYLHHEQVRIQNQEEDSLEQRIKNNQPLTSSTKKKKIGCTCKKTFCLKMYCQCFSNNKKCNQQCACGDCKNGEGNQDIIEQAKLNVKQKGLHNCSLQGKRCNCKKSFCQKKYCQCFNAGVNCTDACKCIQCSNKQFDYIDKYPNKVQIKQNIEHSIYILQKSRRDLDNM